MEKSTRKVFATLNLFQGLAITLSFLLMACGDDSSSGKGTEPAEVADSSDAEPTSLDGVNGFSQKGPFIKGSSVKVLELESGSTLKQTGRSFDTKIQTDDGHFVLNASTMVSQYVELHADGFYKNEVTGESSNAPLTLYALTDVMMREGGRVNINLLTHLEYQRVVYLVKNEKMRVSAAKRQAQKEVLAILNIDGNGFEDSEDLSIVGTTDADGALLAYSILFQGDRSVADLTELLQSVVSDLEQDGEWNDEKTKTEIADWASAQDLSGGLSTIRSNIEKWNLGSVPDFEKHVRNFWYTNYRLGSCNDKNQGEILPVKNELSKKSGADISYVCKSGAWVEATDFDKETYGKKCSSKEVGQTIDDKYYCTPKGWTTLGWSWDVPKDVRMNFDIDYGSMTDNRDGKIYRTVTIGEGKNAQIWMAENLNYYDATLDGRSWCYNDVEANCAVTGRYYTWAAAVGKTEDECGQDAPPVACNLGEGKVQGICPDGWHLPNVEEWELLITNVGGEGNSEKALKSRTGWNASSFDEKYSNGTDAYGFSALPAGEFTATASDHFRGEGSGTAYWSTSLHYDDFTYSYDGEYLGLSGFASKDRGSGLSVRCLKD